MRPSLSRSALLRRAACGAGVLPVPAAANVPARAVAGDTPPDGDLAYLRLLVGMELLAIDFQTRALAQRLLGQTASTFRRSVADEKAHYGVLARLLGDSGQQAATSADVDFAYPRGSFVSRRSIARLGWRIETLLLGAYLGAVESVQTPELRLTIGQIVANEAQHLSALAPVVGKLRVGSAFPAALTMSAVSDQLDRFES